jgi:RNA polymerase sigma factor (sigma-70 family)
MHALLRYLRRAAPYPVAGRPTDGQLLDRFLAHREEAAFEELVRRHGPMVLGVCRRVLANEHDVEDAFQATFLVLVHKAASVQPADLVGHWIYGVAHRTALRARALDARRRAKEQAMPRPIEQPSGVWQDVLPLLDQELTGLPEKYRIPVVLCDLQGKSRKEVAGTLGCSEGTLSSRLARARALLGRRLSRRGVTLAGGELAALVAANGASAGVPAHLLLSTTKAALLVVAGQATTAMCVSLQAAALTKGVIRAMFFAKLKTMVVLCAAAAVAIGAGGLVYQAHAGKGSPSDRGQEQGQAKPGKDERGDNAVALAQPTVEPPQASPDLPSDAATRLKEFEAAAEAIRKKADAEMQVLRDKLLADLRAMLEASTQAGKLDEAVAIRERIRQLQAVTDKARNLLVNGSFEEGPPTPNDGVHNLQAPLEPTCIKGWRIIRDGSGPVDHTYWQAADGKISLGLWWKPPAERGGISQTFKTKKGQKYRVTFWMAGDPHGGPGERKLQVSAAGSSAEFVFDMSGKNRYNLGWQCKSWVFTAVADRSTLEFSGLTQGDYPAAIDDVVVVAVKE